MIKAADFSSQKLFFRAVLFVLYPTVMYAFLHLQRLLNLISSEVCPSIITFFSVIEQKINLLEKTFFFLTLNF